MPKRTEKYPCIQCQMKFSYRRTLEAHVKRVHDSDKTFHCTKKNCRKTYYTQANLDEHLEHFHNPDPNQNPKQCQHCSELFPNIRAKIDHIKAVHNGNKKEFLCERCPGVSFTNKQIFQSHMKAHNQEKEFLCSNCGRKFSQLPPLKLHLATVCKPNASQEELARMKARQDLRVQKQREYRARIRKNKNGFKCKQCGTLFLNERRLIFHTAKFHKDGQKEGEDEEGSDERV
jgi:KRAB domain-containing zinc finger protein